MKYTVSIATEGVSTQPTWTVEGELYDVQRSLEDWIHDNGWDNWADEDVSIVADDGSVYHLSWSCCEVGLDEGAYPLDEEDEEVDCNETLIHSSIPGVEGEAYTVVTKKQETPTHTLRLYRGEELLESHTIEHWDTGGEITYSLPNGTFVYCEVQREKEEQEVEG